MSLVSIIIPTYNTEKYIEKCIQSVLEQTYTDYEIIIVDDCSTDNSMDVVARFKDPRIKVIKNEINRGPSYSRNRGIQLSKGDFIAILDSDDWWTPNRLEVMMDFMESHHADVLFDNVLYIREGEEKPYTTYYQFKGITVDKARQVTPEYFVNNDLGILKAIIRKEIIMDHSIQYEESITYGEDFIFYLEIITKTTKVWLLKEGYYYYLSREGSLVKNFFALTEECLRATEEILEHPKYELTPGLMNALEKRKSDFEFIIKFHETDIYIQKKEFKKAINNFMGDPKLIKEFTLTKLRLLKYSLLGNREKTGS